MRALQREVRGREIPWILLLPGELSAPVRRRYAEEVERAREPLVAELAHAVEIAEARHASSRSTPQSRR